jgi:glycine hydroxymethyltransferase
MHDVLATDPDVWSIVKNEYKRQTRGIELIASENYASDAVMSALGSCMTNKYSEGQPGSR